jgi:hypothetical protein
VTTKRSLEILHANHTSISRVEDLHKQRVVQLGAVLQAKTGSTTCVIEKIIDRNFPIELKEQPLIICLNRSTNFFVSLSHPELNETVAQVHQHKKCIIPAMLQKQQQAIQRDIGGFDDSVIHGSQSQPQLDLNIQDSLDGKLIL